MDGVYISFVAVICAALLSRNVAVAANVTEIATPTSATPITDVPSRCYYFDSRDGTNRTCALRAFCFTFIRRQSTGSFRTKKGCSSECTDERRKKKIQVCCRSHLCNIHQLTPDNFTQATPTFHPSSSRMPTISTVAQTTSSLMIGIRPFSSTGEEPASRPTTESDASGYLTCNCNTCGPTITSCVGKMCGVFSSDFVKYNYTCENDTSVCNVNRLICCDVDFCNGINIHTTLGTTTHQQHTQGISTRPGTMATTIATPSQDLASSDLYFNLATIISAVGGVIIICITMVILAVLIVLYKRRKTRPLSWQPQSLPPTYTAKGGMELKQSPSPSCSTSSSASGSHSSSNTSASWSELIKHLGTSV